jgi:hypothetical protein
MTIIPNETLDRMMRSAVAPSLQSIFSWRAPHHRSAWRYMTHTTFTTVRALFLLLLTCLSSCVNPQGSKHTDIYSPPVGTFVSSVVSLRLNDDGTYLAEDLGPAEYAIIMEGTKAYPSKANRETECGRWSFDEQTRKLLLTPDSDIAFRWGLRQLRVDATNADRLDWGSGFLERKKD